MPARTRKTENDPSAWEESSSAHRQTSALVPLANPLRRLSLQPSPRTNESAGKQGLLALASELSRDPRSWQKSADQQTAWRTNKRFPTLTTHPTICSAGPV